MGRRTRGYQGQSAAIEPLEPRLLLSTTYLVNSLADNTYADGAVTLREAISAANSDSVVGDAAAGDGADVITFDPALAGGTIVLNGNQLVVGEDLTITGPGSDLLTIDANDGIRHIQVNLGVTLTMTGLTLAQGNAGEGTHGGSIYTDGALDLTDVVFTTNRAGDDGGAIYATEDSPAITLTGCEFTANTAIGNGGGVMQMAGTLVSTDTSFVENEAKSAGGGIATHGVTDTATIVGGEFTGNTAGSGGGLYTAKPTTVTDVALGGNEAMGWGGGVVVIGDVEAVLTRVDFDANTAVALGGGLHFRNANVELYDCTFDDNSADIEGGAVYAYSGSLLSDSTTYARNSAGTGGAIYVGNTATLTVRGTQQTSYFQDNTATAYNGGAIFAMNNITTISGTAFLGNTANTYGGAIRQGGGVLRIGGSYFESNDALNYAGGAILLDGADGYIAGSTFLQNTAANTGGAIRATGDAGVLVIDDCTLTENEAGRLTVNDGGAIVASQRRVEIHNSRLVGNTASGAGGAIRASSGATIITGSLIADNIAGGSGGGIAVSAVAELHLVNSTVSGNAANTKGGGVYIDNVVNVATITNTTITNNRSNANDAAAWKGGGLYITNDRVLLTNSIISGSFAGSGVVASDIYGGVVGAGSSHNLVGTSDGAGGLTHAVNGNLVGLDPLLGPLQDNGGASNTHTLLVGSPAIDAADNALALAADGEPLWYDQRGRAFDRLVGLHVDIGAYEAEQPGGELRGRKWFDLDHDGAPDEAWGMNILINGGFEDNPLDPAGPYHNLPAGYPNVYGWAVLDWVQCFNWLHSDPAEGMWFMDLNYDDGGAIAQTLVTQPGRRYRVSFQMAGLTGGTLGVETIEISAAGESAQFSFDSTAQSLRDVGWETKTWEFVAQDPLTTLTFQGLSPGNWAGPTIDNVVVQPYGRDDVRIYLDANGNQSFDAGEPLTFLRPDDPSTPDVDETGTYRFTGLPDGSYGVRELLANGFSQISPIQSLGYGAIVTGAQIITGLDFGNQWDGVISGTKYVDLNGNGRRDRNPLPGDSPTVLMVVDVSGTSNTPVGFTVGDMNGDGRANYTLDAELFAMDQLRQELISLGWGHTAHVGVVVFSANGVQLDMDPAADGVQLLTTPLADTDGDGVTNLEQVLRSVQVGHSGTSPSTSDFEAGLAAALSTLAAESPAGDVVVHFASDGLANSPWSFADEVDALDAIGAELVAWGFGVRERFDLGPLRRMDPFAEWLTDTDVITDRVTARSRFGAAGSDGRWLEPGLADVVIYIDADANGQLDWADGDGDSLWDEGEGERWVLTADDDPLTAEVDETGWYSLDDLPVEIYVIREVVPAGYVQTEPVDPDQYVVDLRSGPITGGYDFGNQPTPGSIRGRKGLDVDHNGQFEPDEPGQAGVVMFLDIDNNSERDTSEPIATTDADGWFTFTNVSVGSYVVREVVPEGFAQVLPASDVGILVDVAAGQEAAGLLFVNEDLRGCIEGFKFLDLNANSLLDDGESGFAGVRIFLDLDENGYWSSNEPYALTQEDDPATLDIDETGLWSIPDVVPGDYTVRETSPAGYSAGFPGPGGHSVTVGALGLIGPLLFGNIPLPPMILGWKYNDFNGNGYRDRSRLQGDQPHLVLTVDVSDSTRNPFIGQAPGDVNGDRMFDQILDGELAGLIAVNQEFIDRGLGGIVVVSIVAFGDLGFQVDMDPVTAGLQLTTTPDADLDQDGVADVEQALRSLTRDDFGSALRTDYQQALQTVTQTLTDVGTAGSNANMLFVSDGEPNYLNNYADEVAYLKSLGANLSAAGAGQEATLYPLEVIDPDVFIFTSPAELVAGFTPPETFGGGTSSTPHPGGSADGKWLEPGLPGVTVYLDANNNGQLDWTDADGDGQWDDGEGEHWVLSQGDDPLTTDLDETGRYILDNLDPGTYIVREIVPTGWIQTAPTADSVSDLAAYFPFSGNADDATGLTSPATVDGAALVADRFGAEDTAFTFDGIDDYIQTAVDSNQLPLTISVWFNTNTSSGKHSIVDSDVSGSWGHSLIVGYGDEDDTLDAEHHNGMYDSPYVVAPGAWQHGVVVYDGESLELYVNGVSVGSKSYTSQTPDGSAFRMGRHNSGNPQWFDGEIDDVRIYYRDLSARDVANLYLLEARETALSDDLPAAHLVDVDFGDVIDGLDFGDRRYPYVAGRHLFYNNSSADGADPAANAADDNAVDGDLRALMPGRTSSPVNYSGYSRGINGVMVDIEGLAGVPGVYDFLFRSGDTDAPSTWAAVPAPTSVSVRPGAGVDGSDRVTIIWDDNAIQAQWLEVRVLATAATGLGAVDVFYFANVPADATGDGVVDLDDFVVLKQNFTIGAGVDAGDFDANGAVDLEDFVLLKKNYSSALVAIEAPTWPNPLGDANDDGAVDLDDFVIFKANFGTSGVSAIPADFNGDGEIGLDDFVILKRNFGTAGAAAAPAVDLADLQVADTDVDLLARVRPRWFRDRQMPAKDEAIGEDIFGLFGEMD